MPFPAKVGQIRSKMNKKVPLQIEEIRRGVIAALVLSFIGAYSVGCAIFPRNLEKMEDEVRWLTYVSPAGVGVRLPDGADLYGFRAALLHGGLLVGGGLELGQVMYFRDSDIYVTLLSPYVYYSPLGIAEPEYVTSRGEIGRKLRTFSFLYAGAGLFSLSRKEGVADRPRSHFDVGAGLSFKRIELRAGAVYKYRKSLGDRDFFPYFGLHYQLFGSSWQMEW